MQAKGHMNEDSSSPVAFPFWRKFLYPFRTPVDPQVLVDKTLQNPDHIPSIKK